MNAEIPVPLVSHVRPGSEMIFGPQGPIGYRQPEHMPKTSKQALGYGEIAQIIGLSADTEPKTVKRAALDWMGLPRPRERVLDAKEKEAVILFSTEIQNSGSEVIWIPIGNQAGQHRPQRFDLAKLPSTGKISLMENVVNTDNRPFRLVLASTVSGNISCDIEYGAVGGETGRTFERYKFTEGETDPQRDTIAWSRRLIVDRKFAKMLHETLPPNDFIISARNRFVVDISHACTTIQRLSERISSLYSQYRLAHMVGVEGYMRPGGECIFVDTDFPSADAPRWMRGER